MRRRRRKRPEAGEGGLGDDAGGRRNQVLFAVAGLLGGVVFLALGASSCSESGELSEHGLRTRGTVVSVSRRTRRRSGRRRTVYRPTVRFQAEDGRSYTFEGRESGVSFDEGETVDVLYPGDDPEEARLDDLSSLWVQPLVLVVIGLVCLAVGGSSGWKALQGRPPRRR